MASDMEKTMTTTDPITKYIRDHSLRMTSAQEKLLEMTLERSDSDCIGDPLELQLLQMVVKMIGAKKTLDIGVYTGYSALCVALVLPDDGKVVALDTCEEFVNVGKPFWKEAGVDHKIDLRIGSAAETLNTIVENGECGTFDFAFIDADKPSYKTYYELCLKLIRKGGVIALDNTLLRGTVTDPNNTDERTVAIRELNTVLAKDERVDISFLRIGDGLTLCRIK